MGKSRNDELNKYIGRQLRSARTGKGVSQVDFAARSGISQPRVSRVESGSFTPDIEILILYCKVLNMTPGEILNILPSDPERAKLLDYINHLSPGEQSRALTILKAVFAK